MGCTLTDARLRLGPTVDFRTYSRDVDRFAAAAGVPPRVLEVHVLNAELDARFDERLHDLVRFLSGRAIDAISFHCPDNLQNISFLSAFAPADPVLRECRLEFPFTGAEARSRIERLARGAGLVASRCDCEAIVVVHQGVYLPAAAMAPLAAADLDALRLRMLEALESDYRWMLDVTERTGVTLGLETSPPGSATGANEHLVDHCFDDVAPRLALGGRFVLDTSHVAMASAYFRQSAVSFAGMESVRRTRGGVPASLRSLEAFVDAARPYIGWLHLSDATGCRGVDEGRPIQSEGSLIDWVQLLGDVLPAAISRPRGVLELVDSHRDFTSVSQSIAWIRERVPGVFAPTDVHA